MKIALQTKATRQHPCRRRSSWDSKSNTEVRRSHCSLAISLHSGRNQECSCLHSSEPRTVHALWWIMFYYAKELESRFMKVLSTAAPLHTGKCLSVSQVQCLCVAVFSRTALQHACKPTLNFDNWHALQGLITQANATLLAEASDRIPFGTQLSEAPPLLSRRMKSLGITKATLKI